MSKKWTLASGGEIRFHSIEEFIAFLQDCLAKAQAAANFAASPQEIACHNHLGNDPLAIKVMSLSGTRRRT